jgi:hypothetical protein
MVTLPDGTTEVYVCAFFCNDVLNENGLLSAIRIVDTIKAEFSAPLEQVNFTDAKIQLVIMYRTDAPCDFTMRLMGTTPDHERFSIPLGESFHSDGGVDGANIVSEIGLKTKTQGTYWFDLLVEGKIATRFPLRVIHSPRAKLSPEPSGVEPPTDEKTGQQAPS